MVIVPILQPEQDSTSLVKHNSLLTPVVKEDRYLAIKQMDAINQEDQVRVMSPALDYDVIQPQIRQPNFIQPQHQVSKTITFRET